MRLNTPVTSYTIAQAAEVLGVSDDTELAYFWSINRFVRIADGPDEVHMAQLGRQKIAEFAAVPAKGRSPADASGVAPAPSSPDCW